MNLVEQFNHDLNRSDQNRYEKWSVYRKQINFFIEPFLNQGKKKEHLLILGAGNCDDLDLAFYHDNFFSITLADIDIESMNQGLQKQGLLINDFEILQVDFTGHETFSYFDHFIDDLLSMISIKEIKTYLSKKMKNIKKYRFLENISNQFDTIIITPIYTQLIYHQVQNAVEVMKLQDYPQNLIDFILSQTLQDMTTIIDLFNKNTYYLLKPSGSIIVLSDIFQSHIKDPFYQEIILSFESKEQMDKLHQSYIEAYGYGLGDYGHYSMEKILKYENHTWILWPFSDDIHLCVKTVLYINQKK